jgi:putative FmdB family regulatory protein
MSDSPFARLSEIRVPLYDYQCKQCRKVTEVRHGFHEAYAVPCRHCGGELSRVFNPAGIVFKGSGFYITDSRKSAGGESGAAGATAAPAATTGTGATTAPAAATPPSSAESKKSDAA